MLDVMKRISRLQFTAPEKLSNKDEPRRMHGSPWEGEIDEISWVKLGVRGW